MDVRGFKRDPERVLAAVEERDGRLIAKVPLTVHIPRLYAQGNLGSIESLVRCIGYFAIVLDNQYYATIKVTASVGFKPAEINVIKIYEVDYLELRFGAGEVIMPSLELLRNTTMVFTIYDEIVAKGKTPWYLDYADLGSLFDTAQHHANFNPKADRAILEMMAAARARDSSDRTVYYRTMVKTDQYLQEVEPDVIPLRSVAYGATNTTARLLGAYLGEGMTSSLVNPTDTLEKVEELLLS